MNNKEKVKDPGKINEEQKIREPFDPERTPEPPQDKHPTSRADEDENSEREKPQTPTSREAAAPGEKNEAQKKEKIQGEAPKDIEDETSI